VDEDNRSAAGGVRRLDLPALPLRNGRHAELLSVAVQGHRTLANRRRATNTIHLSSGGWTATRTGTGTYTITFGDTGHGRTIVSLTPIAGNPPGSNCVLGNALADNAYEVRCYEGNGATPWVPWDVAYHVIAIGG
jgi:hypothetical protein